MTIPKKPHHEDTKSTKFFLVTFVSFVSSWFNLFLQRNIQLTQEDTCTQ